MVLIADTDADGIDIFAIQKVFEIRVEIHPRQVDAVEARLVQVRHRGQLNLGQAAEDIGMHFAHKSVTDYSNA